MEQIKNWQNRKDMETLYLFMGRLEDLNLLHIDLPQVISLKQWHDFMENI